MFGNNRIDELVRVVKSIEERVTQLENDVYRAATREEMHKDAQLNPWRPATNSFYRRASGKVAEAGVERLEQIVDGIKLSLITQQIRSSEIKPVSVHTDRNGTAVEIGSIVLDGAVDNFARHEVIDFAPGGFYLISANGSIAGCPPHATPVGYARSSDVLLESTLNTKPW